MGQCAFVVFVRCVVRVYVCLLSTRGAHDRVWAIFSARRMCDDLLVMTYPVVKLFIVRTEEGAETGEGLDLLGLLVGVL